MNIDIHQIKAVILPGKEIIIPPPPEPTIYGVEWKSTYSSTLVRTDDSANFDNPIPYVADSTTYGSPFDNIMPWAGIERVTNKKAGELVKIPKFWYKLDISTEQPFKLQITNQPLDDFKVAPAFMDRGDGKGERDYVYVGRYHCNGPNLESFSGNKPQKNFDMSYYRTKIHSLGSNIYQWDYAMLITIQMLYLVEFANWNVQSVIGGGCSETSDTVLPAYSKEFYCGKTDSMPYHTGTISAKHTDYGSCQYRYIEDLWGNCWDVVDGIYFQYSTIYIIKNPENFSNMSLGVSVGARPTSSGYIQNFTKSTKSDYDWVYYPSSIAKNSYSSYVRDYYSYYQNRSRRELLMAGGNCDQKQYYGLFYFNSSRTEYDNVTGSRIMYLP